MRLKKKSVMLGVVVLSFLLSFFSLGRSPIKAEETYPHAYRGPNFIDVDYGNGTHGWTSASYTVWNGSHWVDYIFRDLYTSQGKYIVQVGLVGTVIYDYYAEFYDPNMTSVRLYDERWEVQKWKTTGKGGWDDLGAQAGSPTFTIVEYDSGINITKSFHGWAGWLNITYVFHGSLKHEVLFASEIGSTETFRVLQKWSGIVGDRVKHQDGEMIISGVESINGTWFEFRKSDGSLSVFENQFSIADYLEPVDVDVHAQGMKCDFMFSNWTLANGEALTIDPSTASFNDPTEDGYTYSTTSSENWEYTSSTGDDIRFFKTAQYAWYRGYVEWDITSVPDNANITEVLFQYHGKITYTGDVYITEINNRPSTTDGQTLVDDIKDGTVFLLQTGFNFPVSSPDQERDLGDDACDDLEAQLSANWWAIGLKHDGVIDFEKRIYSEEYSSVQPPPTLNITYTANNAPTITSASISDRDDTDNCYAMESYYSFVAVVNDAEGATDIDKVYLRGKQSTTTRFEVRATSLTGTPSFAIQTGASIIDLDTGSCSWGESGNEGTATFKVRFEWDYTQEADCEIAVYVEDSQAASAGWTNKQTNYYDVITRLVTDSFTSDDGRINLGGSTTLSGNVHYATTISGNTASSKYPLDAQFTAVHIHDSAHSSQGNDASIINGAFSIVFNIPSAVQSNTYHVYLDLVADYSDADAPDGDTTNVIGDQLQVQSYLASDARDNINDNVDIDVTIWWDYNDTACPSATITINGFAASHQGSGVYRITRTSASVTSVTYDTVVCSAESGEGITTVDQNGQSTTVIWDNLLVSGKGVTDSRTNINEYEQFWFTLRSEQDSTAVESGTVTLNGSLSATWIAGRSRWEYNTTKASAQIQALYVASINWNTYTITSLSDQSSNTTSIIWDTIVVSAKGVTDGHTNINEFEQYWFTFRSDYDSAFVQSGTVTLNGSLSATWQSGNSRWEYNTTKATTQIMTLYPASISWDTYSITSLSDQSSNTTSIIWDSLEVYDYELEFLGNGEIRYEAVIRYGYDGTAIDGASLKLLYPDLATETSLTASNSTGWVSFILSQANITQTGEYRIYGDNDNNYDVTYKMQNQTFSIHSLILNSKDNDGTSLSGTTIKVYNGSTLVHSPSSEATCYYPETSYTFNVYWLQDLLVNQTGPYSLTGNSEVNLTCACYPFVLAGTTYHVGSNATINTAVWNSSAKKMAVTFTESIDSYILVSSATTEPTYVLNCTYDVDVNFSSYLILTHYSNLSISIGYPNWATTRIHRTDHIIISSYWSEAEKLYIILSGTSGENGTLEVYCGSRSTPRSTTALTTPTYFSGTTMLAGTYTFMSTTTVTLDWTTDTGSSGTTITTPSIFLTAKTLDTGQIQQGTSKTVNATVTWIGRTSVTISSISFSGEGSEWLRSTLSVPLTVRRLALESEGKIQATITIRIPQQAKLGKYKTVIEYHIKVGYSTYQTSANIMFTVTSTPLPPGGIPSIVSILLLISLVGIVFVSIQKR